ncbi:hypothetical protein LXL04_000223 [Taraxacum kok-saghyz]
MPWPSYPKSPTLSVSSSPGPVVQVSGTLGAELYFLKIQGLNCNFLKLLQCLLQCTLQCLLQCRLLRRVSGATVSSSPANWFFRRVATVNFDRRFGSLPVVKKFRKKYFRNQRNETFPTAYTKIVSAERKFRPKLRKSLSGAKPSSDTTSRGHKFCVQTLNRIHNPKENIRRRCVVLGLKKLKWECSWGNMFATNIMEIAFNEVVKMMMIGIKMGILKGCLLDQNKDACSLLECFISKSHVTNGSPSYLLWSSFTALYEENCTQMEVSDYCVEGILLHNGCVLLARYTWKINKATEIDIDIDIRIDSRSNKISRRRVYAEIAVVSAAIGVGQPVHNLFCKVDQELLVFFVFKEHPIVVKFIDLGEASKGDVCIR